MYPISRKIFVTGKSLHFHIVIKFQILLHFQMTASLTKVLSWLMEHCLKYELEELRGELANSFPSIVPGQMSSAILPDFDNLILLSLLRKLSNGDTMQITNLKDLDSVIAQFQDQRIENNFFQT